MSIGNTSTRPDRAISMHGTHTPYDVIVVGGGMAGLTASAYAARAGLRVMLCDKEPVLGGLVRSFQRDGFTWDAGIRALEDSGIILPMLKDLGIDIDFVKSPVSLGIEDRVIPVESVANLDDYRQLLEHFYPESRRDIARILEVVRRVMKHMDVLYGIENPAFKDLRKDRDYLFRRLLPWLGKFLLTIGKINRMSMPVDEYLTKLSDSPALIDIISQHFFRKTPTFFALSYFSLYLDYMYPVGGTDVLPRAVESYCAAKGVDIRTEVRIVDVDPIAHTVGDQHGRAYAYRKLVWAADLKTLYQLVDIDRLPQGRIRERIQKRASVMRGAKGGDSVFTLYLGVDIEPAWFSAKSNGHFFYTATRRGVGPAIHTKLDAILADAESDADAEVSEKAKNWIEHYIRHTTYEISIPVLKDASLAPEGKTGLIVSVLSDHALWEAAHGQGWYDELRTVTEEGLIETLDATVYPGLRRAVTTRSSSTPITIANTVGSAEGAITGWAFINPVMPAIHKMQHVAQSVVTPFPDVAKAGQWSYSPSGLPIAILTGKLAADRVTKELRRGSTRGSRDSRRP
jgi:phytoene dehydrogenase-like protein